MRREGAFDAVEPFFFLDRRQGSRALDEDKQKKKRNRIVRTFCLVLEGDGIHRPGRSAIMESLPEGGESVVSDKTGVDLFRRPQGRGQATSQFGRCRGA